MIFSQPKSNRTFFVSGDGTLCIGAGVAGTWPLLSVQQCKKTKIGSTPKKCMGPEFLFVFKHEDGFQVFLKQLVLANAFAEKRSKQLARVVKFDKKGTMTIDCSKLKSQELSYGKAGRRTRAVKRRKRRR